jgi:hypothetical protein
LAINMKSGAMDQGTKSLRDRPRRRAISMSIVFRSGWAAPILTRGIGPGKYRHIYMHRIALEDSAKALNPQSQLNTDYDFFKMLSDHGRGAARRFFDAHFDDIGARGTVDLAKEVQAEWA